MEAALLYTAVDGKGELGAHCRLQPSIVEMLERENGQKHIEGWHDSATNYVQKGEVLPRPPNPARLEGQTLLDLPAPCVIVIDGVRYECADDTAELDLRVAKTYTVVVEAFPAVDAVFRIEVSA